LKHIESNTKAILNTIDAYEMIGPLHIIVKMRFNLNTGCFIKNRFSINTGNFYVVTGQTNP
jgi:hypothetical protein